MKITFFEASDQDIRFFKSRLKNHKVEFTAEPFDFLRCRNSEIISIFIYSKIDKKALSKLSRLKLIATRSTGFNHIDLNTCKRQNIIVCNVPFYGENTVAEHTFALILSLSRNVHKSYVRTQKDDFSIEGLRGFDLKGKTLGVIGTGHIGMHVIRMAEGFGMDVIAYDLQRQKFLAELLHFRYVNSIDVLYKKSDIITLHIPATKHTYHMINKKSLSMMKKNCIIINTSRGNLVDTDALYEALVKKRLGGAGLDVVEGEEFIKEEKELLFNEKNPKVLRRIFKDKALFDLDNVVFTPHNAFNSNEAIERIMQTTLGNISSFLNKRPVNVVN